jgi:hypothetical protein
MLPPTAQTKVPRSGWMGFFLGLLLGSLGTILVLAWLQSSPANISREISETLLPETLDQLSKLSKDEIEKRKAAIELVNAADRGTKVITRETLISLLFIPLLSGVFILIMGQWVNYSYWRKQQQFEGYKTRTIKMIEVYSDLSQFVTNFLQLIVLQLQLHETQSQNQGPNNAIPKTILNEKANADEYEKERLKVEPKLAQLLRETKIYFEQTTWQKAENLRFFYNDTLRDRPITGEVVEEFQKRFGELLDDMETEVKTRMGDRT